jgi:hypothetical protein
MSIAWSFSFEISVLGITHLPMTTPKSTISEPHKHLRIGKALWFGGYHYGETIGFKCGHAVLDGSPLIRVGAALPC